MGWRLQLFIIIHLVCGSRSIANDSIPVFLERNAFVHGDTLEFIWDGNRIGKGYAAASLHLWADHVATGRRWKFRYPIINGSSEGALVIGNDLPDGTYALNFMATEQFLSIEGTVKSVRIKTAYNYKQKKRDTLAVFERAKLTGKEMRYTLLNREDILHNDYVRADSAGRFNVPPIIFGDTAQMLFDPGKGRGSYWIEIVTPLDSAFTPFHSTTVFIAVQSPKPDATLSAPDSMHYEFSFTDPYPEAKTLEEVKVLGKTNAQKYEERFVSQLFRSFPDARTFDALDNNELMRSNNLFNFLRSNVAGLFIRSDGIVTTATWRGANVDFYINEFPVGINDLNINPMDIALIKVYPPPAQLQSLTNGGAVAIYTKRGIFENGTGSPLYNFMVGGYTQGIFNWR